MNTLVLEGAKHNIKVNALAPTAGTRMTEDLLPPEIFKLLTTEAVTAGALTLCHEEAPNRITLCAGVGGYSVARIVETEGVFLPESDQTPEDVLAHYAQITSAVGQKELKAGSEQGEKFLNKAMAFIKSQR
jgi:hypothetical protein